MYLCMKYLKIWLILEEFINVKVLFIIFKSFDIYKDVCIIILLWLNNLNDVFYFLEIKCNIKKKIIK